MNAISVEGVGNAIATPRVKTTTVREGAFQRDGLYLLVSTLLVGMGNYGFSLGTIWLLRPADFSEVASLSALLLVVGSASNASLPWVLTRSLTRYRDDTLERSQALGFTLVAAVTCGSIASLVVLVLSARYASPAGQAATALTAFLIFVAGLTIGFCQGTRRFVLLATLTIIEVGAKFGIGLFLAARGAGAAGAIAGTTIGALIVVAVGIKLTWHKVRLPSRSFSIVLAKDAARIGLVQLGVSLVVTMDIVAGSIRHGHSPLLAGYQAITTFTRLPFFASIAISMVAYPRLAAATDDRPGFGRVTRTAMRMYLAMALGMAVVVATLPGPILRFVLPDRYAQSSRLLIPLAIAGFGAGLINMCATIFQSRTRAKAPLVVLGSLTAIGAVALSATSVSSEALAWCAAALLAIGSLVFVVLVQREAEDPGLVRIVVYATVVGAAGITGLHALRGRASLWLLAASMVGVASLYRTFTVERSRPSTSDAPALVSRLGDRGVRHARFSRRLADGLVHSLRPLAPPAAWEMFVQLRSLVGDGPAIVTPVARRVLVLAPHPDDETIGCGGTIARLAASGSEVRVVVASDGEATTDEPHARDVGRRRRLQGVAACASLGVGPPVFLGLRDTGLRSQQDELIALLTDEVSDFQPDIVFAPWPLDAHVDHRSVATGLAGVPLPSWTEIWSYEVWASLPANRLVDVSQWWDVKLNALNCHALDDEGREAHLALQRWRSLHGLSGHGHAEAFLALTASNYRSLVSTL